MTLYLHPTIRCLFSETSPLFEQFMALQGQCFRQQKGRLTQRIVLGDQAYFIKQHHGIGWREIFKNILQFRWPVISAKNEWQAIQKLRSLGIAVPEIAAYGEQGTHPAYRQSFILMKEITSVISLEELAQRWQTHSPTVQMKRHLIAEVARIARTLHQHGINHRDFYLCHFLLENSSPIADSKLYLIDLHRAQLRDLTPRRWIIKDLVGLYFSSKGIGLTQRDYYRFMQHYQQTSLRKLLPAHSHFWLKVKKRGEELYRDHL